jgi:hypothetical protein
VNQIFARFAAGIQEARNPPITKESNFARSATFATADAKRQIEIESTPRVCTKIKIGRITLQWTLVITREAAKNGIRRREDRRLSRLTAPSLDVRSCDGGTPARVSSSRLLVLILA